MKKLFILLFAVIIVLAGCSGSTTPEQPDLDTLRADIEAGGFTAHQADYTNANGYTRTLDGREFSIDVIEITETVEDDALYLIGTAKLSNDDFIGTADVTAVYVLEEGAYDLRSVSCTNGVVSPSVPLDFQDPDFWDTLSSMKIRYQLEEDKEWNMLTGRAEISADTVESMTVAYIPSQYDNEAHERYRLTVTFTDDLTLEGELYFDYWPAIGQGKTERHGYEKWEIPLSADFEEKGD